MAGPKGQQGEEGAQGKRGQKGSAGHPGPQVTFIIGVVLYALPDLTLHFFM